MPAADPNTTPSAPKASGDVEEELSYYKSQYEQLEVELAEFQASSRELEAELEKDIEASEKRERQLKGKAETLGYEVEEWKVSFSSVLDVLLPLVCYPYANQIRLVLDQIQTSKG